MDGAKQNTHTQKKKHHQISKELAVRLMAGQLTIHSRKEEIIFWLCLNQLDLIWKKKRKKKENLRDTTWQ